MSVSFQPSAAVERGREVGLAGCSRQRRAGLRHGRSAWMNGVAHRFSKIKMAAEDPGEITGAASARSSWLTRPEDTPSNTARSIVPSWSRSARAMMPSEPSWPLATKTRSKILITPSVDEIDQDGQALSGHLAAWELDDQVADRAQRRFAFCHLPFLSPRRGRSRAWYQPAARTLAFCVSNSASVRTPCDLRLANSVSWDVTSPPELPAASRTAASKASFCWAAS